MSSNIETLSQPITLANGVAAPNRFLKSAMTERLCTWSTDDLNERGKPTDAYIHLYKEWAKGRTGIIILGNIPCDYRYPEAARNACIDPESNWDQVAAFKPVVEATKAYGGLCIGQITHAGRQTPDTVTKEPISASDIQSPSLGGMTFGKPRPATIDEIKDIVRRFAFAAKVLYDAGADGCELHIAHGYLLSQFLSPRVNQRTDQYGGSLENRSRIHFEILEAIRKSVPDERFILSVKINSHDFIDGGFSEEESQTICKRFEEAGVTLIELSGGTYESMAFAHKKESTKRREAFFLEFADRIRPNLSKAKLAVTGGFRSLEAMSKAINEKSCDIVGLARPLTQDLDLPELLLSGKRDKARDNLANESTQTAASYFQLGEVGDYKQPSDLSDPKIAKQIDDAISKNPGDAFRFRPVLNSYAN